jgi:hypothetical protein
MRAALHEMQASDEDVLKWTYTTEEEISAKHFLVCLGILIGFLDLVCVRVH